MNDVEIVKYYDFSDAKEIVKIPSGSSLKDFFPGFNWKNYVIFANGVRVDENYKIKENDLVSIRSIPHLTTAAIIIGVVALAAGVYAGVAAYKAKKDAEKAQKEMEKLQSQTSNGVTNIPYMKGASNSIATSKTQPYIIGRHLFTPYILNAGGGNYKGFHKISGAEGVDQYYYIVLEGGFNKQILESISCDDLKVADVLKEEPQEGRLEFNSNSVFAADESFIEVAQDGAGFSEDDLFNTKIVENEVNDDIGHADDDDYEPLYYTLEDNTKAADVTIMFNGLYYTNDSGTRGKMTRNIVPAYSLDYAQILAEGGDTSTATWKEFDNGFDHYIYHDKETVNHKGVYTYEWKHASHKTSGRKSESALLKLKSSWTLINGEDIKDNTNVSFNISQNKIGGSFPYKYRATITATYQEEIPAYKESTYSNKFTYNKKSQIRFNAHQDFSFDECFTLDSESGKYKKNNYPIVVRITTPDKAMTSGSEVSDCYVQYIQSTCFNTENSLSASSLIDEKIIEEKEAKLSTLIGIKIKVTTANEEKLGKINIVTNGIAPTWDSETKDWLYEDEEKTTFKKSMTSNVASWVLEILTSNTHAPSAVDLSEIDLEAFGEWFEYCDENALNVNKVLTNGATKENVLSEIVVNGRGVLYENIYGKISVAWDHLSDNAMSLLNEQNLVSFSYEKDLKRQPDGVKLTFIDSENGFAEDTLELMYNPEAERTSETTFTEINASGITSYSEAYNYAHYTMNVAHARVRKATAEIGKEGIYFVPYSKVLVQHSSLKIGLGNAEIKAVILNDEGDISGVELYEAVDLNETDSFYAAIQCVSNSSMGVRFEAISGAEGRTKEIYFETPIDSAATLKPKKGDLLSYGTGVNTITEPFIIAGIERSDSGYSLTLYDYNENIFDFGDIPDYVSPLSSSNAGMGGTLPTEVPSVYPTIEQVVTIARENAEAVRVLDSLLDSGTTGEVAMYNNAWFKFDGTKWNLLTQTGYLGTKTAAPENPAIDSFFLSLFEGTISGFLMLSNGNNLTLFDGNYLELNLKATKGNIYYFDSNGWHCDTNRNSWRYVVALADLQENGFELPSVLPEIIETGSPCYLGALSTNPASFKAGDWFVAAEDFESFKKGQVYKLIDGAWIAIDQADTENAKELMTCLSDLLKCNDAGTGYFSTIFANALIANEAFINKLAASVIKLQKDSEGNAGVIYGGDRYNADGSDKDTNATGFYLDTDGNLKANSAEFTNTIISGGLKLTKGFRFNKTYSFSSPSFSSLFSELKELLNFGDGGYLCNASILIIGSGSAASFAMAEAEFTKLNIIMSSNTMTFISAAGIYAEEEKKNYYGLASPELRITENSLTFDGQKLAGGSSISCTLPDSNYYFSFSLRI